MMSVWNLAFVQRLNIVVNLFCYSFLLGKEKDNLTSTF